MSLFSWAGLSRNRRVRKQAEQRRQRDKRNVLRRQMLVERLDERAVLSALVGAPNPNETVTTGITADQLAAELVGGGVSISNAHFTGSAEQSGNFTFNDATVVGFGKGIILSSGKAADVVGPNLADWTSSTFPPTGSTEPWGPGDANLDTLSGYPTYDAAVLEFDFVPTANQVVFDYAFASDEYPEWVNTPFNDVFAFYVNGTNYATVRQVAGDPTSPQVPVAVNNINNGNPEFYPDFVPQRPDLFRPNYFNPNGASAIDLEQDGITHVLTFQAPVTPGVVNHMKLAIADASDGIYDSAVFIQAGSLVSNKNPVADLSLLPESGQAPLTVTAVVEGEDPDGAKLTYTINWGDGTSSSGPLNSPSNDNEKTTTVTHTYLSAGDYVATLIVSNGTLDGTSSEDVKVWGTSTVALDTFILAMPSKVSNDPTPSFTFGSTQAGSTFEYSLDNGATFTACPSNLTITSALTDGAYTIQVRATNAGVTDVSPASYTWTIDTTIDDTTAPDLTIVTKPANPSNDIAPTFTFFSTDPEAEFEFKLDLPGALEDIVDWEGCNDMLTLDAVIKGTYGLVDGTYTIEVQALDNFGNASEPASYTWTVDTVAPVTTITDAPLSPSDDSTPTFSFEANEDATFTCTIDGATVPAISGVPLKPLANGEHTFTVKATDAAGNEEITAASYTWTIDVPKPVAPGVALANDTGASADDLITKDGTLEITKASNATVKYSIDNGTTWSSIFTAAEGLNTVQVRQTDLGGNMSDITVFSFTLDTAAPAAPGVALANDTGSLSDDGITNVGTLNVSSESGASVQFSTDGTTWVSAFSANEGLNTVQVRQTDLAGNVSGAAALSFTLDTSAPAAPGVKLTNDTGSSSSDGITNDDTLTISSESGADVEFSDDGTTWKNTFNAQKGLNTVQVRQTDVAGNVSEVTVFSFTLDTTAPAAPGVTLANDTGNSSNDGITNVGTLNVSSESGASVEFSTDGTTWASAFSALEGLNTVQVRQTDLAGNASGAAVFSFTLDTTAPAAPGVTLANDTGSSSNDGTTNVGTLNVSSESGATVQFSSDGGTTWGAFVPTEGLNAVLARQTDPAGNVSDAAVFSFTLDTTAPAAPGVALANDTGNSSNDGITNVGTLNVSSESGANVDISTDGGATWGAFVPTEGFNAVLAHQTDLAGNVSGATALSFTLDTTAPTLNPTFSQSQPFVVGTQGITVSPNAADAYGVASSSAGAVDTSTVGQKSVICSATDVAGNSTSVSVPYSVIQGSTTDYHIISSQTSIVITNQITKIPLLFQLTDANNHLVPDKKAQSLLSGIKITFDNVPMGKVHYHKGIDTFASTLKIGKQPKGAHQVVIHLNVNGVEVSNLVIAVTVV